MADGRMQLDWNIASQHMAILANCHRDAERQRPFKPSDFNPMTAGEPEKPLPKASKPESMSWLKAAFCPAELHREAKRRDRIRP